MTSSESSHFVRGIAHEAQIVRRGNSREGLQSTHEAHLGLGNFGLIIIFATKSYHCYLIQIDTILLERYYLDHKIAATLSTFLSEKLPFWFQAFGARRAVGQRNSDMHYFQFMKFCMEYCKLAELNSSLVGDQENLFENEWTNFHPIN